jgi:hypothetical protein
MSHIDTQDLNLFKDNSEYLKQYLQPLEISLNLTISSCMENFNINPPQRQKSILKEIEVKFKMGYVRIIINADFNAIEFLIERKVYKNHVIEESQRKKLVSISNAGNVPIKLKCYLLDMNINDNLRNHIIRVNSEFISFDELSAHKTPDVVLEKKIAHKSTPNCYQENFNTTLIVEVLPNGIIYKIPIKIEIKEINMEPIINTKAQSIRILASETFIYFGACDIDDHLVQDLILQNPNDFNVICKLKAITLNANQNLFLFDNNQDKFFDTQLEEIKANSQMKFKIRFQPISMRHSCKISEFNGYIKVMVPGYELNLLVRTRALIRISSEIKNNISSEFYPKIKTSVSLSDSNQVTTDRLSITSNTSRHSNKLNSCKKVKAKIWLKQETLEFPEAKPGQITKMSLEINNSEDRAFELSVMQLMEPFSCKHVKVNVKPNQYVPIPIEFKPLLPGGYRDQVLLRVDSTEYPLSCVIKAKCK